MHDILFKKEYSTMNGILREIKSTGVLRSETPANYQPRKNIYRADSAIASQDQIDICLNCTKEKCYGECDKIRGKKVVSKKK